MAISSRKIAAFTKLIASLADKPNLGSTTLLKQYFDSSPDELKTALNGLIDDLLAIGDGTSGADNIGATTVTGIVGNTVQTILENIKVLIDTKSNSADVYTKAELNAGQLNNLYYTETELNNGQLDTRYFTETELGSTTDNTSGADKIGATTVTGLVGNTVQALLEALKVAIDNVALGQIPDDSLTTAKMATEQKRGVANGVASLDGTGQVPLAQLGNVPAADLSPTYTEIRNKQGRYQSEFNFDNAVFPFAYCSISGDTVSLASGKTTGTVEKTITPPDLKTWGNLKYTTTAGSAGSTITCDIYKPENIDETTGANAGAAWTYPVLVGTKIYAKQSASPYKMWIYDTLANTWDTSNGGTPSGNWDYSCAVGTKIYVRCGATPTKVWIYETTNNTWDEASGGSLSGGGYNFPVVIGTKFYALDGAQTKILIYETTNNTWDEASGGTASASCSGLVVVGTKLYTKKTASNYKMFIYDTTNNTWDESSGGVPGADLAHITFCSVGNIIYVKASATQKIYKYDTVTNTFDTINGLSFVITPSYFIPSTNKIYVTSSSTGYKVVFYNLDVLLKSNVTSVGDISDINVASYPSIKMIYTLTRLLSGDTSPTVLNPSLTWEGADKTLGTWEKISETTLGSTATQIDFNNISSSYKYLKVTFTMNSNSGSATNILIRFNDDSANNYTYQYLSVNNATVTGAEQVGQSGISLLRSLAGGNVWSVGTILINNVSTTFRRTVDFSYLTYDGSSYHYNGGGYWSTNLITKLSLVANGTYKVGTNFVLWGCK